MLSLRNFSVKAGRKEIIKAIDLDISGKVAMLGPNGSGKSTLAYAIAGHPDLESSGRILLDGMDISGMDAAERAKLGIFLSFQHPPEFQGLSVRTFLSTAWDSLGMEGDFESALSEAMSELSIPSSFLSREMNAGFSGGEKKRMELLQIMLFRPKVLIVDEIDSGLDVDSLNMAANVLNSCGAQDMLLITHYTRILRPVRPDRVVVLRDGRIIKQGGMEVAEWVDAHGYE